MAANEVADPEVEGVAWELEPLLDGAGEGPAGVDALLDEAHSRAEAFAAEHRIGRAHGSYDALLADPDVDAVYVPLPNSLHVPWSIRALQAGKHVLAEKPLTRRPEEAQAAFDAAEHAGRVLAEGFMWRHHPQAHKLRELVRDRVMGSVRLIRASFSFDIFAMDRPEDVRLQAELDGGGLMDVGCYCVSGMRLLAGEPERVSARQISRNGVDVRLSGTMAFAGGVLGVFDCGLDMAAHASLEVVGEGGSLYVADPWHSRAPGITLRRASGEVEEIAIEAVDPYACELEDFAAAVRGERPHPFGREDAVGQARTIAALYRSAEFGAEAVP
jgi:predicted dehydrogenase